MTERPTYQPLPPPSPLVLGKEPFPNGPPGFAIRLVLGLRSLLKRLTDALAPGELILFERATEGVWAHTLAAVCRLGIPDVIDEQPLSADEIAKRLALDADAVNRVLRTLTSRGIFRLTSDGRFEHSRLSRLLKGGRLTREREFIIYFNSGSNLAAWARIDHALRTGDSPFDHVHGMTVWEWFDAHPDERETFAHMMMGITTMDAPALAALYPFREITKLCDVGGGRGTMLSELLIRHPHLRGVLCDGAGVLESARTVVEARGVADRMELVPGSFFEKVPSGCDAYLLKNVLHDWDDPTCERILRTVRDAAAKGAKLLIAEALIDPDHVDPMRSPIDLQMMVACTRGRERTAQELRALMSRTGFTPQRVFDFPTAGILEGIAT